MTPIGGGACGQEPIASATTGTATIMSQTGATLSGSYSSLTGSVTEVGFRWGTSSGNLSNVSLRRSAYCSLALAGLTLQKIEPSTLVFSSIAEFIAVYLA